MSIEDLAWAQNLDVFERAFMTHIVPSRMRTSVFINGAFLERLSEFLNDEFFVLPTKGKENLHWQSIMTVNSWSIQMKHGEKRKYRIVDPHNNVKVSGYSHDILKPIVEYHIEQEIIEKKRAKGCNRIAIVFDGGGGNGSYQIGVWKYLHERGVDSVITGVAGASVGALNSILFISEDFELAEAMWRKIETDDFIPPEEALNRIIRHIPLAGKPVLNALDLPDRIKYLRTHKEELFESGDPYARGATFLLKDLIEKTDDEKKLAMISQGTLKKLICDNISLEKIRDSDKIAYSSVCAIRHLDPSALIGYQKEAIETFCKLQYRCWNSFIYKKWDEILESVLASAAHPLMYDSRRINNIPYVDGGLLDNSPHKPLCDAGFKNIIAVHLNQNHKIKCDVDAEVYKAGYALPVYGYNRLRKIFHILPSEQLGSIYKSDPSKADRLIGLGYSDAHNQLGKRFLESII